MTVIATARHPTAGAGPRTLRIVLAAPVRQGGGVWRHLQDLAGALAARGHKVRVALPDDAGALRHDAVGLHLCSFERPPACDIWHLHLADTYDRSALSALTRARVRAGGTVITEHLPRTNASDVALGDDRRRHGAWTAKTLLKQAHYALSGLVVAPSAGAARFVQTRYGLGGGRVAVVANGIDPGPPPGSWPAGPSRYLAVGALIRQKGFDVLVDAAAQAGEDWCVDVAGDGPHLESLRARAAAAGPRPGNPGVPAAIGDVRVRFVGQRNDISRRLDDATGLVAPSRWESSSYVALETMARARPVVATRVDGLDEIVVDGVTGLLVAPDDAGALAGALDLLAGRPDQARAMGLAGRRRLLECFTLDLMAARTESLYRRLLAR
jgi:glycosyltransferase involved in cell wall biosynthesis